MGGVYIGLFASTGNECDVSVADVVQYAVEQPEIRVVSIFAETIRQPDVFLSAAMRALELDKVIISVTPGGSEAVARAAMGHTASIVGSAEVYDSVCSQYGILRADSIDELVDLSLALQDGRRMHGRRIGVITQSGGAGVLVAGNASDRGLDLPEFPEAMQKELLSMLPDFASARNPVDTTAAIGSLAPDTYGRIADILLASDRIDGLLPLHWTGEGPGIDALHEDYVRQEKPIVPCVTIDSHLLGRMGVPTFEDPTRAVRALSAMATVSERRRSGIARPSIDANRAQEARQLLSEAVGRPFVLESTAKAVLALYGVPVSREIACYSEDDVVSAARAIGGPVAIKVLSYQLPHKSDSGGLALGLEGDDKIRAAYRSLMDAMSQREAGIVVDSILVQEMVHPHMELAVGVERDPLFGPMVAVGLGGTLIEIIGRPVLLRAPFDLEQARAAVLSIAEGRITHKTRGLSQDQVSGLSAIMVCLADLSLELPEVTSVDVNPIMATSKGLTAVDALIVASEV
jgi:acetyltransferase